MEFCGTEGKCLFAVGLTDLLTWYLWVGGGKHGCSCSFYWRMSVPAYMRGKNIEWCRPCPLKTLVCKNKLCSARYIGRGFCTHTIWPRSPWCVSGWVCVRASDHLLSDSLVTHASFLILPNPSCTGQPMERASISARSPAFLLDTQVGTTLSFSFPICHCVGWFRCVCTLHCLDVKVEESIFICGCCICSVFSGVQYLGSRLFFFGREGGGFCVAFHVIQTDVLSPSFHWITFVCFMSGFGNYTNNCCPCWI